MEALKVAGKIVGTFVICLVLGILFNLLVSVILPDPGSMPHYTVNLINGPKSLFVILGAVGIMYLLFKRDRRFPLGFRGDRKIALSAAGAGLGILLLLVTFAAVYAAGEVKVLSVGMNYAIWVSFGVTALLALCDTFTEEILLRGYIQGMIKSSFGAWSAVWLSSLLFAVLHSLGHDVLANPLVLINLALAGIFLALLRELSGSLWLPIGAHFTWNAFGDVFGNADSFVIIGLGRNEWINGGSLGVTNGFANTLIMMAVIAVLSLKLQRVQTLKKSALV